MTEPMSYERREEIRAILAALTADHGSVARYEADERHWELNSDTYATELLAEADRLTGLFEKLAAATGRLDFDRSESAPPETQEQWIEFVREVHEHAEKIIDQYEGEAAP